MILRFEIDGIEYFINTVTFEVGLSISGLARLCGVSQQSLSKLLSNYAKLITYFLPTSFRIFSTAATNEFQSL
jgi:hypothetical protein